MKPAVFVRRMVMLVPAVLLAACATQPPYHPPALSLPPAWANTTEPAARAGQPSNEAWWEALNDPAINELVASAFRDSPTLAQAVAKVDEARATVRVNAAQRLPTVSATAGFSRAQVQNTVGLGTSTTLLENSAQSGPSLSWELDLWGRIRQSQEEAKSRLDARTADALSARLSLAGQVANTVLALRACQYSLKVRDNDITSRLTELTLMQRRLAMGNVAPADEANASGNLATARINRFSQQEQCTRNVDALVALSGRDAGSVRALLARPLPMMAAAAPGDMNIMIPVPPPTRPELPATILLAHPSVVSAEREAAAAWADIGVARANRLPKLDLNAALASQWLSALGSSLSFVTWSIGPGLSTTLFDGGAGKANVDAAEARYRGAVATLQSTLRTAVQNVEDGLAGQASAEARAELSQHAMASAAITLKASEARWKAGMISMFDLESARRQWDSTQETAILAARDRCQAWVNLIQAMGHAPADELPATTPPSDRKSHDEHA